MEDRWLISIQIQVGCTKAGSYLKFDGFQGKNMETAEGFWSMFPQTNPMRPLGVLKNEVYPVYPQISNMIGKLLINYPLVNKHRP